MRSRAVNTKKQQDIFKNEKSSTNNKNCIASDFFVGETGNNPILCSMRMSNPKCNNIRSRCCAPVIDADVLHVCFNAEYKRTEAMTRNHENHLAMFEISVSSTPNKTVR